MNQPDPVLMNAALRAAKEILPPNYSIIIICGVPEGTGTVMSGVSNVPDPEEVRRALLDYAKP